MKKEDIVKKVTEHSVIIKEVRQDVKEIRTNELPHLRKRLDWVLGLIISGLLGAVYILVK